MEQKKIGLVLLLFLIGLADANLMVNVKPGNVSVGLDNSIEMSFAVPEEIESYNIETANSSSDVLKFNRYEVYINEAGSSDSLLTLTLYIYQTPQYFPVFEEKLENDLGELGKSITIPVEIDGNKGYVDYSYPSGNPAVDPLSASAAGFTYYPSASPKDEDLEGIYEVQGDTMGAALDNPKVMPILQEVMQTIHLSGI